MPIGNANQAIPGCGMHHIAVQCRNLDESLCLYRDVLGMIPVLEFGGDRKIVLLDMGDGSCVELLGPQSNAPRPEINSSPAHPLAHLALTTTDTFAAVEKVRKAGYAITSEPKRVLLNTLGVINAFFVGPNGEIIEFFQVTE
jgi:glyoxylase I family protein